MVKRLSLQKIAPPLQMPLVFRPALTLSGGLWLILKLFLPVTGGSVTRVGLRKKNAGTNCPRGSNPV